LLIPQRFSPLSITNQLLDGSRVIQRNVETIRKSIKSKPEAEEDINGYSLALIGL
jgi:hypothetical protein